MHIWRWWMYANEKRKSEHFKHMSSPVQKSYIFASNINHKEQCETSASICKPLYSFILWKSIRRDKFMFFNFPIFLFSRRRTGIKWSRLQFFCFCSFLFPFFISKWKLIFLFFILYFFLRFDEIQSKSRALLSSLLCTNAKKIVFNSAFLCMWEIKVFFCHFKKELIQLYV